MTFSPLPLSYCTNVHPGLSVAEVESGLSEFTVPTRDRFGDLAAGLWLARPVVTELLESAAGASSLDGFAARLRESGLLCYTLNTFPYGNFHDARVKENVYIPDWTTDERYDYTLDCARVLARLLPADDTAGSLSTVPLGFKGFDHPADFIDRCAARLIDLAEALARLRDETGKTIRLAIEPEPLCVLETTPETLAFFARLREIAADRNSLEAANEFLGVCYDVCHQSVEFEDVAGSINALAQARIRINKVHITCAIRVERPAENEEARNALATFVEPRYLHQTIARSTDGTIHRLTDLTEEAALNPQPEFAAADEWRVHFHVPVNAESLGPLGTTRPDLRRALATVRDLDYAPHLEVETYTWQVLPGEKPKSLVDGLTTELEATRGLLCDLS
ncbi:MAG: metabolite traffic protein EboE [Planctomycetota bacterium]|nr:metabolite traffic protein EboE [Planctomycetota bacterium]MDA1248492.1 metabolite traffic protein EboE [Planctomycetota bacterium]